MQTALLIRKAHNLIERSGTVWFHAARLSPVNVLRCYATVSCDNVKLNIQRSMYEEKNRIMLVPPVHLLLYNRAKSCFKNIRPLTLLAKPVC